MSQTECDRHRAVAEKKRQDYHNYIKAKGCHAVKEINLKMREAK